MNKTTTEIEWALRFKEVAEVIKGWSKDQSTQIGAVIADKDNTILSTGYNSFPRGIIDTIDERQERPEKYFWMEHAERNALYNLARTGACSKGATMYLTCDIPCADCSRGIINSGITRIWVVKTNMDPSKPWLESSIRSLAMFKEAGVDVVYYQIK